MDTGYFNGSMDEFEFQSVAKILRMDTTEYNNQSNPGAFTIFSATESALPQIYNITGSGSYCVGSGGLTVNLSGSQTGVNYQLKKKWVRFRISSFRNR